MKNYRILSRKVNDGKTADGYGNWEYENIEENIQAADAEEAIEIFLSWLENCGGVTVDGDEGNEFGNPYRADINGAQYDYMAEEQEETED